MLEGRGGNDSLSGDAGSDTLYGGSGDDGLSGGSGDDFLYGDEGDDRLIIHSQNMALSPGNDFVDGGVGRDIVQFVFMYDGVTVDLSRTDRQSIGGGLFLTVKNVEDVEGSEGDDRIIGDAANNTITGNSGDDVIDGGGGVDTVVMRGFSRDYAITWTKDGWKIQDLRPIPNPNSYGADGTDTLKNVEFANFYDRTVVLGDGMAFLVNAVLRDSASTGSDIASSLSAKLASGALTPTQAISQIVSAAGASTSVATLAYQFFTGKIPSQAGVDYLVSPTGPNANNLNSAYYQSFNLENRYINFAVNLGKLGEGKDAFAAKYGALSMVEATREAYKTIFGAAPTDAKIHAMIDSRLDYFAAYGRDGATGVGTKAAMVGWLLAEAQKADLGVMVRSNDAWLTDLADGSAPFAISLLDPSNGYYKADFIFGGQ
jgi:Ca2+-binding RTX toxin-like protein